VHLPPDLPLNLTVRITATAVRTQAVGGMLFRCEACPLAFCEDHLPPEADVVMESQRYNDLGMRRIAAACYVRCSPECLRLAEALAGERAAKGAAGKSPKGAAAAGSSPKGAAATAAAAKSPKGATALKSPKVTAASAGLKSPKAPGKLSKSPPAARSKP
jgi:hypothetical protein